MTPPRAASAAPPELAPDPLLPPCAGPSTAAIAALDGAIVAAMPNFGPLMKDAENTYLKTSYLPLDTLLEDVRPALTAVGILISSCFKLVPGGFVVVTTLTHSSGGFRFSMFPVGDPSNAQKVAAAATYGLRVNLCQLLALVGRDDDGEAAQPQDAWARPAVAPAPPPVAALPAAPATAPAAASAWNGPPVDWGSAPPAGFAIPAAGPPGAWEIPPAPSSAPPSFV
jgi:hypothetical protein